MKRQQTKTGSKRAQLGMTLIEVMVATAILATIATISYQTLNITIESKEVVEAKLKELSRVDRAWLLLEADFKNALGYAKRQALGPGSGELLPPLVVERNGDYALVLLRGGHANPLNLPRSELIRVGYRVEDETLFRDVWYDLGSIDQDESRKQKIIDGVERVELSVLSDRATSYSAGPWLDNWTLEEQVSSPMPLAVKVTMKLEGYEEITRVFALLKGE